MTKDIEVYFKSGCGRCPLFDTIKCKVNTWQKELKVLRKILNEFELVEEMKWGVPCYTFGNKNILLISAFIDYCAISFFKVSLLNDPENILIQQTKNVQATRQIRFTNIQEINKLESIIKSYIYNAIEIEKKDLKVNFKKKTELILPEEFLNKTTEIPELKIAFESLTPGRQRAYNLYFSAPKQSKTRESIIEKYNQNILNGKGIDE
jgi:uncharacterized protein YdeI (YjbR/CyaY-like superfamily)